MSSCDKILGCIKADCDKTISEIDAMSEKQCKAVLDDANAQAEQVAKETADKAQKKIAQMKTASKSRAELEQRNMLLAKRREEIDITFNAVYDYLIKLDDKSYFNTIYKLASKLNGKSGEVLLNSADLSRLPSDFEAQLKANGLNATVSKTPASISAGFILRCGDIEENMDFKSILADKRDDIEDLINRELFAE